jgi:CubicO group peptidase (beta-lactamase class C family)
MRLTRTLLALGAALLAGCATAPEPPAPAPPAAIVSQLEAGAYANTHSLLIYRGGVLVAETYRPGLDEQRGFSIGVVQHGPHTLHDARSISKTVVALLYGIALSEGRVPALDTPAIDAFPEYAALATPERRRVTIGHMLTMTSGFAWDEFTLPYSDARNSERMMDAAADRYRYVFEQPFAHEPGTRWTYSGGDVAVIAAIVERGVGMDLESYAQRALFRPLGVTQVAWLKDHRGVALAASGLRIAPRDLGRIGVMMSRGGDWNGRQIVPSAWMAAMLAPHATVGGEPPCGMRYGYFTWLGAICAEGQAPLPYAAGIGYGGQRLWLVPARDLVIVSNAGNYQDRRQGEIALQLLRDTLAALP